MVDDGSVALTDFGIAAILSPAGLASSQSAFTPLFTAPEVLEGRSYTRAADVYALGVTMYTLLTGNPPFVPRPGEGPAATLQRITTGDAAPLPDGQPEPLRKLIADMTAVDPARRPGTEDVRDRLATLAVSIGLEPVPVRVPASEQSSVPVLPDSGAVDLLTSMQDPVRSAAEPSPADEPPTEKGFPPPDPPVPAPPVPDPSAHPGSVRKRRRPVRRDVLLAGTAAVAVTLLVIGIYLPFRYVPDSGGPQGDGESPSITMAPSAGPSEGGAATPASDPTSPTTTPPPADTAGSSPNAPDDASVTAPGGTTPGGRPTAGSRDETGVGDGGPSGGATSNNGGGTGAAPGGGVGQSGGQATTAPPPPANTLRVPAGSLSPQMINGTCVFRIWFGNFGDTPFAKVRVYSGACGGMGITVISQRGDDTLHTSDTGWGGGTDECGSYYEGQATGRGPAIAVGQRVNFAETGQVLTFLHDSGRTARIYARC